MRSTTLTLTPAYGRDYNSRDEVVKAWNEGLDFKIANPGYFTYCSKHSANMLRASGIKRARLRYARLTKIVEIWI